MSSLAVSSLTVKTVPSEAPREAQGIESDKVLNERVLRTVRRSMPIDLLFLPRYSLNLAVFLEDQNFLLRVAKHLEKYMEKEGALSQDTLHSPEIDRWVTEKFTSDQELYLTTFYELCMEALKNPHELLDTREAIAGRIYTVKNALISQLKPECLQRSQKVLWYLTQWQHLCNFLKKRTHVWRPLYQGKPDGKILFMKDSFV